MKQCLPISALFLVLLCCLGFSPTYAQTTVTIGSGTLSNYFYGPIYRSSSTSSFDYSRYHYLFTASELAAAGVPAGATITKIEWNKTSAFNITGAGNAYFNVFMNNTSSTALTSGTQWGVLTAGSTHVFAGVYNTTNNLPAAAGWVGFTLALPFAYAGGSLEISTDWDVSAVTGTTTGGAFNWEYTSGAAFTQTLGAANSTALTSTTTLSTSSYGGSLRPNIRITFLPPSSNYCAIPAPTSVTNLTGTSATLNWTPVTGAVNYQWAVKQAGTTVASGTSTGSSVNVTGLSPVTSYIFEISTTCSSSNSVTTAQGFTTPCASYTPPYTEGFATYVPSCWSEATGALAAPTTFTSTTSSLWIADGFANVGTTGAAKMNIYSTARYEWLISPSIDLSGGNYQLEFDLALTAYASTNPAGTTGTDDKFAVVISTDNGATWSSANTIRQWDNAGSPYVYNSIATTGEHVILDLTPYTGTIKVGFYAESTVSNADNDLFVDNVEFLPVPSCSKPQSLAAVSDTTSAVISWMGGAIGPNNAFQVEWDSAGFTQGSGNVVSVNGTSTTLTGLASLGYYTFYVRQYCGGSDYSTWAGPFTFRTQSNIPGSNCALALPAVVGVNAADGPSDGFGAITPSATHADWFYFTPTQNALMSVNSCGGGVDTRLYIFSGNCGSLTQVGTNDDACDMGNGSLWASSLSNIAVTAGTTYYIYWDNFNANSGLPFNWTLSLITCGVPSNLNVTNIASSSATLGWTNSPAGNNNSFQIQYGPMGFALGTGTDVYSTTNSYNLAGLSPQTFYGYYVRQICSVGDTSGWVGPRTFRTQPICGNLNTANLPFFEGFEYTGYTTQTSGDALFCSSQRRWDFESDHAAGRVQFGTNAPLNCGGTGAVLLDVSPITTSPVPTQYLTLTLNMAAHAAKSIAISFDFRDHGDEVHANDRVWARGDNSQPWVQVYDWSTTNLTTCTSVLDLNITTPLAAAGQTLGTTFQLRFGEQDDNPYSSDGLTIDNVSIYEYYCAKPTALNATNITQTGATLGWTMGTTGASKWDVQYGTTGFAVGSGTTVVASGTPQAVVSGLMNNTGYEFYVREYCSTGGKSNWTGPFAFRTLCGVIAAPYSENFESIAVAAFGKLTPTCWETTPTTGFRWESEDATGVNENSLNTGPFYDHTYEGAAGGKYMYTEASSGSAGNTADLVSPWISFAGMVNPTVDFYYHMYGQHISRLDVQATTDGVNYTTVYSLVGPQHTSGGAAWKLAQVKLTGFDGQTVQVRFRVTRGSSFEGDVSIDDVSFNGNCPDNTFALAKNSALGCNNATTTVTGATPAGYTTYWFTDGVQDTVAIDNGNGATVYINDSTFFYVQGVNQTTGCVGYDTILVTPYTDNNVLWENVSSTATVQPGNILYKTGTVIGFNAGASSVQRLAAGTDGWAEMVLTNNKTKAFGLSSVDAGYDDKTINFGFRSKTSNTYDILENGKVRTNGSYQLGDVFRVQRMNGQIFYLVNGAVKYVSTVTSTSELLVDVSLSSGKTQIDSVDISFPCGDPMTPCTDLAFNIGMPNDTVCTDSSLVYTMPMYYNTSWFEMGNPTPVFTTSNGGSITLSPMMSKTYVVKGVHMLTGCIGYDTLDVFVDTTCCDLHWTNVSVGVVVNPNNTLTKTSTNASSQLGAISEEFLPAGNSGSIEITMASNTIYRAFGFSPSFTGATLNNIAFGIRMNASGQARIIEYGVTKGPALTYVSGDVFSVRRSGSVVAYLMNGAVVYTSTVASTTDLYVNGTVVTSGATLEPITNNFVCPCYDFNYAIAAPAMDTICYNETYAASGTSGYTAYWYDAATATLVATDAGTGVVLAPTEATTYHVVAINNTTGCIAYDTLTIEVNQGLTWTNFSNSTFVDANQTLKRVNQTGSTIGFTEGASSVQGLGMNEDGWVELTVQAVRSKAFGFSEVDTAYDFKSILYGFQMIATGGLNVFEAGKRKYQGTYAVGTVLRVSRVGGVVSFSVNGTTVYTSTLTSTAPLIVDASIASNNANLERLSTSFICPPAGSANRVVNNSNQTTANPNRQGVAFEGNITVSPNPTTGILNIQAEQPIQRILVVDVFGRVLKQIHGTNANQITVSIEDLATGVYLIQVDGKTIKVVKD